MIKVKFLKEKQFFQTTVRFFFFILAVCAPYFLMASGPIEVQSQKEKHDHNMEAIESFSKVLPEAKASENDEKKATGVPILMYHHVGDFPAGADGTRRDLTVSTANFTEQVRWLKTKGYTSVTLKQLYDSRQGKFALPAKPIVLTFDDGYEDVFENAVPVLLNNEYTGSFAVITSFPGREGYATWEQIIAAHKLGMEIVSHTHDHFDGSNTRKFNESFVFSNLLVSREDLHNHGIDTQILVYPYGHYTENYIEQAKKAGYTFGLTVAYGRFTEQLDIMRIPRVRVHGQETMERFEDLLLGRPVR